MRTEKRPKLLKDIGDPWKGEFKAGTILKPAPPGGYEWYLPGDGTPCVVFTSDVRLFPTWFAWVEVCVECNREVCEWCARIPGLEAEVDAGHPTQCHGHAPKLLPCPFCGGDAEICSDGINGKEVRCQTCGAGFEALRLVGANIAAWNRRVKP